MPLDGYQCGIWACKFIEERIKNGVNFNLEFYQKCDIAKYRTLVFKKVFKYQFYCWVGQKRLDKYRHSRWSSNGDTDNSLVGDQKTLSVEIFL
jgi:hypothetical protein